MRPFEYALGLVTILVSLALADLVLSFHRLVRNRSRVTWDMRVPVAGALVVVEIVRIWFAQWTLRDFAGAEVFSVFLAAFVQVLLLVLLAASCLPDEVGERCDLSEFYESNRRYFWGMFALYQLSYFLLGLFVFGIQQTTTGGQIDAANLFRVLAPLACYVLLTILRVRLLDYILPLAIIAFYLVRYWNQSLAG